MAINIIRHGVKKFRITCPVCGCEFEYEYDDIVKTYDIVKQVKCPDCGEWLNHHDYATAPKSPDPYPPLNPLNPNVIWTTPNINDIVYDCDKCPNKPDFKNGKIIIGDSPCTLCPKNKPYCIGDKATYIFSTAADGKADITNYTTAECNCKPNIEKK